MPLPPPRTKRKAEANVGRTAGLGHFRRALRWLGTPADLWIGMRPIRDGAAFTGEMVRQVRKRPRRDPRVHLTEDGRFDLAAMSFSHGLSPAELDRRLAKKRRQTAYAAYLLASLGATLSLLWLVQLLRSTLTINRVLLALEVLLPCSMCFLLAFYQALLNFQVRTGHPASWREFAATGEGFWPKP